jgi:glycosyltransferase involved in cell wall biosynthesis
VIKPGDPGELRQSINFLLANPSLKIKLGENGRKRVEKQFAAETMALKTLEIYKQIANSA